MGKAGTFRHPPQPQVPRKAVPEQVAAPAFDPASGFPWTVEDNQSVAASFPSDPTLQAWSVQPPAGYDPASGFGWRGDDRQDTASVVQTYDPTVQAGSLWQTDRTPAGDYQRTVLADNPQSYWRLSEPQGYSASTANAWFTTYDAAHATREGQWHGTLAEQAAGAIVGDTDTAATFDGSTTYLDVPNANFPAVGAADFTVEAWFRTTATVTTFLVGQKLSTALNAGWRLSMAGASSGNIVFQVSDGATSGAATTTGAYNDGLWHYAAGVRSGAVLTLSVDNETVTAGGGAVDTTNAQPFTLGTFAGLTSFLNGDLDEVAVYTAALSAGQITNHYVVGKQLYAPWQGQGDQLAVGSRSTDDTAQAYPIQPPAAAGFDPASGFPWPTDVQQDALPKQTYAPEDPYTIGSPVTEQLAGIWQGPQPDPLTANPFDDTVQSWAITQYDPAKFPWTNGDNSQDRSTQPTWYDGQDGSVVLVQAGTAPFDPSTGFPWTVADASQDRSTWPVWYDGIDGNLVLVQPFDPGQGWGWTVADPSQDRSLQPVWYDNTDQSWAIAPTFDPSKGAGFISADHPIPAYRQVWLDETPQFPPFAIVPTVTTVTGGYGPSGIASSFGMSGGAVAPLPAGGATGSVPSGSATAPKPSR